MNISEAKLRVIRNSFRSIFWLLHSHFFRVKLNHLYIDAQVLPPAPTYFHRQFFSPGCPPPVEVESINLPSPGEGSPVRWISIVRRLNPGETELFRPGRNATPVASACPEVCFAPCSTTSFIVLRLVSSAFFVEFVNRGTTRLTMYSISVPRRSCFS